MCLTTIVASGAGGSAASIQFGEAPRSDPRHLEPGEIVIQEHFRWSANKETTKSPVKIALTQNLVGHRGICTVYYNRRHFIRFLAM
jgi:hypothetical protein